ncbi:HAD-IA family hydrolase [Cystobacter fuscus]|uniref:HAD-IA family hydrolase n=1 Tax=Cystobacter fuscus TaxID=43 RepID=UPI0037BE2757
MRLPSGTVLTAEALLFDMDGTIVRSQIAAEKVWKQWAERQGVDWPTLLADFHGRRMEDTIRRHAPAGVDVARECAWVLEQELIVDDGVVPVPGAPELLAALPPERWTVVTSAARRLAEHRMAVAGLPRPRQMVAGDDIQRGKPDPQGYLLGLEALGCAASRALVFEDAIAGISAGRAAGARVIAIAGTETPERLAEVDWLQDLSALRYEGQDARGQLVLRVH